MDVLNLHIQLGEALRKGERVIVTDVDKCEFMEGTKDLEIYRKLGSKASNRHTFSWQVRC